jgi:hypothetical protein
MFTVKINRWNNISNEDPEAVTVDGIAWKLLPRETARSIWISPDKKLVIKIDCRLPQAQDEAAMYLRVDPWERLFLPLVYQVGDDYIIEEYVPLAKPYGEGWNKIPEEARMFAESQALDFYTKYDMMGDWQGWGQFGIDTRTGMLCIHDFCDFMDTPPGTHQWFTIDVTKGAA